MSQLRHQAVNDKGDQSSITRYQPVCQVFLSGPNSCLMWADIASSHIWLISGSTQHRN